MRRSHSWVWAAAVLTATAPPARAQDRGSAMEMDSTLRSLVAQALARNPGVSQRRAAYDAATMRIRPAGALPDPMLSAGVMDLAGLKYGQSDFTEIDAQVSQDFPWPGTLSTRSAAARAAAATSQAEIGARRREVTVAVADAYYRLRYLATALQTLSRQRGLLVAAVEISTTRYATGTAPQSDPLQAKVAVARLDAEQAALQGDYTAGVAALNALRDRPASDTIRVEPLDSAALRIHAALPTADSLVSLALRQHPRLAARRAGVEQATQAIRLEQLAARPDFSLSLRYGYRGSVGGVDLPDFLSAFVSLRLPVWAGRKQSRLADAARDDSVGAASALREAELQIVQEVQEVSARATAGERRLTLLLDDVLPIARATLESVQRSYQVGRVDFQTVLAAQDALFRAETETAAVAAEHQMHLVMLRELTAEESQ